MTYEEELKELDTLNRDKKQWKLKIRNQTKKTHKEFVDKNKPWIRVLDITMILVVLLNYGAVFITNALVVKENPTLKLMEANPAQAKLNDYEQHKEGNDLMRAIIIQTLFWVLLISVYLHQRMFMFTYGQLTVTTLIMIYYAFIIGLDFINNFGYLIGVWLWGA